MKQRIKLLTRQEIKQSISPHEKLLLLQHRIFRSLHQEADRLLGEQPKEIKKYEKQYETDLAKLGKSMQSVSKNELIKTIRSHDVTFVADFHTFHQAQRTALRIMRDAILPDEYWWVGLELIPSHFQDILDQFQAGKIDLQTFHEKIQYEDQWGFPWKNYAPIFDWARERGVRLIALNRPREFFHASASLRRAKTDTELQSRDQWAAGIITDLFSTEIKRKNHYRMLVLYGELHLSHTHLPKQLAEISKTFLKTPLSWSCVHQNNDLIYWKLAKAQKENYVNILRFKKNSFCIISSTPWTKLQSLVTWAEGDSHLLTLSASDFEDEITHETDYLSMFKSYGQTISEFLNITPPLYEKLTVKTIQQADFVDSVTERYSQKEKKIISHFIRSNQEIYLAQESIAYLGTPSQNRVAELAAFHLLKTRTKTSELTSKSRDDFFRLILEASFGFFGSLVINPRRKCDLIADHARRLKELKKINKNINKQEIMARRLTLKIFEQKKSIKQLESTPLCLMMSARYVGQILGKKLYQALLAEEVTLDFVRKNFFSKELQRESKNHYENVYIALLKSTQNIKLGPSKREIL